MAAAAGLLNSYAAAPCLDARLHMLQHAALLQGLPTAFHTSEKKLVPDMAISITLCYNVLRSQLPISVPAARLALRLLGHMARLLKRKAMAEVRNESPKAPPPMQMLLSQLTCEQLCMQSRMTPQPIRLGEQGSHPCHCDMQRQLSIHTPLYTSSWHSRC
jgi:hypothetical protein